MTTELTSDSLNAPLLTGEVIYEREEAQAQPAPEFKPGNTPYTQFGNETLNANVRWYLIVRELLAHYTQEQLASETEITRSTLFKVLNQDYSKLTFKMGARLLGVHGRFYPESVC